ARQTEEDSGRSAAAASTVEIAPAPLAIGVAAPLPPGSPPPNGPAGAPPPAGSGYRDWRVRRHRSIPRLRIGTHHASPAALDRLQVSASSIGMRLGRDQNGFPVAITLFRPEPVSLSLIGGGWAARLMASRALRAGARLLVFTEHPEDWVRLGRSVTGRTDRVAVLAPDAPAEVGASADAPVLCLHHGAPGPEAPEPWQTRLLLHRRLTPDRVPAVRDSELVLAQRLTPNEAALVAPALRLTPHNAQQLQLLRDDMMALFAPGGNQYLWVDQIPAELDRIGRPGRY
ncbi:hypothetical protein FNH05_36785, partial [Amycolatopsis rhizosphaerae]